MQVELICWQRPYKDALYWSGDGWTSMIHCARQYSRTTELAELVETIQLLNTDEKRVFSIKTTTEAIFS